MKARGAIWSWSRVVIVAVLLPGWACGTSSGPADAGRDGGAAGDVGDAGDAGRAIYISHESHYCSSTSDDDPYYECSPSRDLVCISTFSRTFPQTNGPPKTVDLWLCQMACTPGDGTCAAGEVCCPGPIYGRSYGKTHACAPAEQCDRLPADAGADAR